MVLAQCLGKNFKKVGGYNEKFKAQDGWEIWQKIAKKNKIFHLKKLYSIIDSTTTLFQ